MLFHRNKSKKLFIMLSYLFCLTLTYLHDQNNHITLILLFLLHSLLIVRKTFLLKQLTHTIDGK
jgi:hypothetical protein